MSSASLKARLFLKLLGKAKFGTLNIQLPDGNLQVYGQGEPLIQVQVHKWEAIDLIFNGGDLGLAQAIMDEEVIVDDQAGLIEWACLNDKALDQALNGTWYGTLIFQISHALRSNDKRGAQKNIAVHDQLGNEFYRLWLDKSMTYSSALFTEKDQSLETAQKNKFSQIVETLKIKSSDRVLDLGCGHGGFFSYLVENVGCQVTAVTNSPEQSRHNQQLIKEQNLTSKVDLQQIDYRDVQGQFDKIVVIEMFESVGEKYWPVFFEKISGLLNPGGRVLIQTTTILQELFKDYSRRPDFIEQYIFPGGLLPTVNVFRNNDLHPELHWVSSFEFTPSYIETLKRWRTNFKGALGDVKSMGFDDRFIRKWLLYLSYSEGVFRAGRTNVGHYVLEKR